MKTNAKSEANGHSSHVYEIDHRKPILVCMCRSTSPLFTTAILYTIQLIWLLWFPFI